MPFGGGISAVSTTSVVASATSAAATIVIPTSVRTGDLLVLADAPQFSAANPTVVVPTGFTSLATVGFGASWSSGIVVSAKIADASSAGSTITGMDGNTRDGKVLYVVRGDTDITYFSGALTSASLISTAATVSQEASGVGVVSPAITIGAGGSTTSSAITWNSGYTIPAFNTTNGITGNPTAILGISSANKGTQPFAQRIDMGDYGTNAILVFWLEVR